MTISRRKLLAGAVAGAAAPALGARFSYGLSPGAETVFTQGALGGGGYSCELSMSDDGLTMITRSDTYQVNIFNPSTQLWEQIFNGKRFSGMTWGQGGGAHAVAVAPGDSNRIYVCSIGLKNGLGVGNRYINSCTVFRSNDRGLTFTPTSLTTIQGDIGGNRLSSPKMAVDPNNADIVYVANQTGIFWVTYNGGSNWSMVTPLLAALTSCKVQTAVKPQAITIVVESNAATAHIKAAKSAGYQIYAYNMTHPLAVGQDALQDAVMDATIDGPATTIRLQNWVQSPGVAVNDMIYLGAGGYVAIDKMSGTVPNPGIARGVPGAKGVASKNLYFGWGWGAAAVWQSTDGGVNFAAMKGGPCQIDKLKISNDATGGVLYLTDNGGDLGFGKSGSAGRTNAWRYVPQMPPTGSGLAANTWTNLSAVSGNYWRAVVPDPTKPGHCVFVTGSDNLSDSTNWGTSVPGAASNTTGATGPNDPPWLAVTGDPFGQNFGDAVFDPLVSGKLWMCNGIGIFYTTNTTAKKTTWTSRTAGLDSLTTQRIVKAPAPNGRILVACQDRPFFSLVNSSTYPSRDHPFADGGPPNITQAGDIIFSDSDPTVVWGSAGGQIWRSTNSGDKWSLIASHDAKGFRSGMGKACLASVSPTSIVAAPNPTANVPVQFGTTSDGGKTWNWQPSLYNGKPLVSSMTFDYSTNGKFLTSDGIGNYYIYDKNNSNVATGGLFKSSDGGANFTFVSAATSEGKPISNFSASLSPVLAVMPGFPRILFYAPGGGYSPKGFAPTPLRVSFDAGVTWHSISKTFQVFQVAFGKAKPGNTYPAIYISGNVADWPNPMNVYRCDDFDGTTTNMHWTPLNNMNLVCCDGSRCLAGDPEVYGTVFIGTGSSGYLVGTIS